MVYILFEGEAIISYLRYYILSVDSNDFQP